MAALPVKAQLIVPEKKQDLQAHNAFKGTVVYARVIDGDTVPMIQLPEFRFATAKFHRSSEDFVRWERLKRNVKKVYPYAVTARLRMEEYNNQLAAVKNKKQKKVYLKEAEEKLKAEFEDDIKNMTVTQGVILIKLIDRETGNSSYSLVHDLKGGFNAFMWQSVARIFGHNLKSKYDPTGEDREIEEIVQMIQRGDL